MIEFVYNDGKRRRMNRVYGDILVKLRQGKIVEESRALEPQLSDLDSSKSNDRTSEVIGKPKRRYSRRDLQAEE